jgi:hypothetical protein
MSIRWYFPLLALCGAPLMAQAPASAPAPQTHSDELGFSYSLPSDWEIVDALPTLPTLQQQEAKSATGEEQKKSIGCVKIPLTARHGTPPSVVVVMAMPFDCFGQAMTEKDLPGFAAGATVGVKQTFEVSDAVFGTFQMGSHNLWIERAKGIPRGRTEPKFMIEIACALLKKAAVCWMVIAADDGALQTFEHGAVSLDGETAPTLVPATAFDKKPAQ